MAGLIPINRRSNNHPAANYDVFDMLDDFFSDRWLSGRSTAYSTFKMDVRESDKEYTVEAELPGVSRDEIALDVDENRLTISVNKNEEVNEENKGYIHRERRVASMSRSIRLGDANTGDIKAKLEHGVLTITVPKREKANSARRINID